MDHRQHANAGLLRFVRANATGELNSFRGIRALIADPVTVSPSSLSPTNASLSSPLSSPISSSSSTSPKLRPPRATSQLSIHHTCGIAGHMAVSFQGGRILCVFDAVTPERQLSEEDQDRLEGWLRAGADDEKFLSFILALRTTESTISYIGFITVEGPRGIAGAAPNGDIIRLIVVQRDGSFLLWNWNRQTALWSYFSRGKLPHHNLAASVPSPADAKPGNLVFPSRYTGGVWVIRNVNNGKNLRCLDSGRLEGQESDASWQQWLIIPATNDHDAYIYLYCPAHDSRMTLSDDRRTVGVAHHARSKPGAFWERLRIMESGGGRVTLATSFGTYISQEASFPFTVSQSMTAGICEQWVITPARMVTNAVAMDSGTIIWSEEFFTPGVPSSSSSSSFVSTSSSSTPSAASNDVYTSHHGSKGHYYRFFHCQAPTMITPSSDLGRGMTTLIETSSVTSIVLPITMGVSLNPYGALRKLVAQRGLFITNGSLRHLYYFSFATRGVVRVAPPSPPTNVAAITDSTADRCSFSIHATSGELFGVDRYGRLLLFIEVADDKHKRSRERDDRKKRRKERNALMGSTAGAVGGTTSCVQCAVQCQLSFPDIIDTKSVSSSNSNNGSGMSITATSLGPDGKPVTTVPVARPLSPGAICQLLSSNYTILTFRHIVAVICAPSLPAPSAAASSSAKGGSGAGPKTPLRVRVKKRRDDDSDDDDADTRVNAYFFVLTSGLCIDAAHYDTGSFPVKGTWSTSHGYAGSGAGVWSESNIWFIRSSPLLSHITAITMPSPSGNNTNASANVSKESKDNSNDILANDIANVHRLSAVPYAYLANIGAHIAADYGISMEHASQKANVDRLLAKISAHNTREALVPPSLLPPSQWATNLPSTTINTPVTFRLPPDMTPITTGSHGGPSIVAAAVPVPTVTATPATVVSESKQDKKSSVSSLLAPPSFLKGISSLSLKQQPSPQPQSQSASSLNNASPTINGASHGSDVVPLPSLAPSNNEWLAPALSSLQNPALAVAALSSPSYDQVVRTHLDSYLHSVTPLYAHLSPSSSSSSSSSSASSSSALPPAPSSSSLFNFDSERTIDGRRRAIRTAFDHYSVLNVNVQGLLKRYSQVLADLQQVHDGIPLAHDVLSSVARLPSLTEQLARAVQGRQQQQIRPSDRSLESLVRQDPAVTLAFLQGSMGKDMLSLVAVTPSSSAIAPITPLPLPSPTHASSSSSTAPGAWSRDLVANEEAMLKKEAISGRTERKAASRVDSLPYFETLCRLYDDLCPELLSPFVKAITDLCPTTETSGNKEMYRQQQPVLSMDGIAPAGSMWSSSYYDRALRILPPVINGTAHGRGVSSFTPAARQLRLARVASRCDLLVASRRLCEAVQFRLAVAVDDDDAYHEEEAIKLAYHHAAPNSPALYGSPISAFSALGPQSASSINDDWQTSTNKARQHREESEALEAVRAELFTHLVRYWLKKRSRMARRQRAATTTTASPSTSSSSTVEQKQLTNSNNNDGAITSEIEDSDLDPRVQALMPQRYSVHNLFQSLRAQLSMDTASDAAATAAAVSTTTSLGVGRARGLSTDSSDDDSMDNNGSGDDSSGGGGGSNGRGSGRPRSLSSSLANRDRSASPTRSNNTTNNNSNNDASYTHTRVRPLLPSVSPSASSTTSTTSSTRVSRSGENDVRVGQLRGSLLRFATQLRGQLAGAPLIPAT